MNLSAVVCGRRLRPRADGGDGRLPGVLPGDEEPLEPPVPGGQGDGQDALDRPDRPVQGELPDGRGVGQLVRLHLPGGDQQAEGDGQVERPGVLPQVGGSEVDDGPPGRAGVPQVGKGPLDAVDALPDGEFGKTTSTVLGSPAAASTSTSTGTASMPTRAKAFSLASTARPPSYGRTYGRAEVVAGGRGWKGRRHGKQPKTRFRRVTWPYLIPRPMSHPRTRGTGEADHGPRYHEPSEE